MDRKRTFTIGEKVCLQKLIMQYKIHTKDLDGAHKKIAWIRLTQDFNNTKGYDRTTAQLKKCWDNIKTRRRLHTLRTRGVAPPQDARSQRSAIEEELGLVDPLTPVKDEDRDWEPPAEPDDSSSDSDNESQVAEESLGAAASPARASPGPAGETLRPLKQEDSPASESDASSASAGTKRSASGCSSTLPVVPDAPAAPASESEASRPSAGAKRRRSSGRSSTLPVVADAPELSEVDQRQQERIEELHKLKVAERIWTLKTLRERHATAQLERQRAHDESERAKLLRDAAEYQREGALLELQLFKKKHS